MAGSFKGAHFPQDIMLTGVRWYGASPLSTRHIEELMRERGVHVHMCPLKRLPLCYEDFCPGYWLACGPEAGVSSHGVDRGRRAVGASWDLSRSA
jgi:hypothetical protein